MAFTDYYRMLGIPKYATQEEIRNAYLDKMNGLSKKTTNSSEDVRLSIQKYNVAYAVLSNEQEKRAYDEVLDRYISGEKTVLLKEEHAKRHFKKQGLMGIVLILCVLSVIWPIWQSVTNTVPTVSAPVVSKKSTALSQKTLPRPINEHIFSNTGTYNSSTLQVVTSGTLDYFVKLQDVYHPNRRVWFYVRGASTARINVSPGTYVLKYACGDGNSWYGLSQHFGKSTSYAKADDLFTFTDDAGWTVELYPHIDGNLETTYISKDKF